MSSFPIIAHYEPDPQRRLVRKAEQLAVDLRREHPELDGTEQWGNFFCDSVTDGPTLHLEDATGIHFLESWRNFSFQQERARLRAGDGDFVASCIAPTEGFLEYFRDRLQLGTPTWLFPSPPRSSVQVSATAWENETIRAKLVRAAKKGRLQYVQPYISSRPVWELANLLSEASGERLRVVGPHPELTGWVNNKITLTGLVQRLLGSESVPRTEHAGSLAKAAQLVHDLAGDCEAITVKIPDSAGGGGNLVLKARDVRHSSLVQIHDQIRNGLSESDWKGETELLVGCWETEVCRAPSAQLWIPPNEVGPPIVEGICEQEFDDARGTFAGVRPADLPRDLTREIVNCSWVLGRLFQCLNYVGRCSFDLLLIGADPARSRFEFLECNGRWGAASLSMTLMNRLFGDWKSRPHAMRDLHLAGLEKIPFTELLQSLGDDLYDARTGCGKFILINPARIVSSSALSVLAIAPSWKEARQLVADELLPRIQSIVQKHMD
jgi:hypothetical protein